MSMSLGLERSAVWLFCAAMSTGKLPRQENYVEIVQSILLSHHRLQMHCSCSFYDIRKQIFGKIRSHQRLWGTQP